MTLASQLPGFPWDSLTRYRETAAAHPGGIVDLSIGTPVDPVPPVVLDALREGSCTPGYPATHGTTRLREAAAGWLARRHGVHVDPVSVVPVIGTKEFIAALPWLLGCGPADMVVYPQLAYPTYEVGARLAGANPVAADGLTSVGPATVRLVWVNSPANPTGRVLPAAHLAKMVAWARERGAMLAADECYLELGWEASPVSVLHPDVCGPSAEGVLAVHSLSKRSNMAGYRAGFITGDPALVADLLEVRRHAGMMMPTPVQAAMAAALDDDTHAQEQKERYASRRARLRPALEAAGWSVEYSEAGLYLWATRPGLDCWAAVTALADLGILVAPGEFYGPTGRDHIRVALTATDERVDAAVQRLARLS
ncbi:MAG TPA: succinyldiaminopimelate transaminase [Streptosporangiaceae bacterium]|nr:succinyldiaminopimelate transaminase [Streptosporangiaceae bacterium]